MRPCLKGEEEWAWPPTTTSCMPWADMTPLPPTTVLDSLTAWKGGCLLCLRKEDAQWNGLSVQSGELSTAWGWDPRLLQTPPSRPAPEACLL